MLVFLFCVSVEMAAFTPPYRCKLRAERAVEKHESEHTSGNSLPEDLPTVSLRIPESRSGAVCLVGRF